jgi:hypothetical protein
MNNMNYEEQKIREVITALFKGADQHNWEKVKQVLAGEVLLDYTSMTGAAPSMLSPQLIVDSWAGFLPGFDKTHHQLSGFRVKRSGDQALANYFGKADHFIAGNVWTVEGTYETELYKLAGEWKITKQTFRLSGQSGELGLPTIAADRMKNKNSPS